MNKKVVFITAGGLASLIAVKGFIQWQSTQRHIEFITWCAKYRPQWPQNFIVEQWGKVTAVGNSDVQFNLLDLALWVLVSTLAVMLVRWLFRTRPVGASSKNLAILLIAIFSFVLIWNAGDYVGHNWNWISRWLHC